MKSSFFQNRSGFSLIEVMVAVALLTVVVFGVVRLQTSHLGLADTQSSTVQAYFLSQEGLEIVEGIGKSQIDSATNECEEDVCVCHLTQEDSYQFSCGGSTEHLGNFQRYFNLDDNGLENGAWHLESVVEWEDPRGTHQVKAKRIIYD